MNATSEQFHIEYADGNEIWLDISDPLAVIPDQIPEHTEISKNIRVTSNKIGGQDDQFYPGTVTKVAFHYPASILYKVRFDSAVVAYVPVERLRILPTNSGKVMNPS